MACLITIEPPVGRVDGLFVEGTVTGGACGRVFIEVRITAPTAQSLTREVPVEEGRWRTTFESFAKANCGGTAVVTVRCIDKDQCEDSDDFTIACRNCPSLAVTDIVTGACIEDEYGTFNSRSVTIKVRAQIDDGEPTPVVGRVTIQLPNGTRSLTNEFNYDGHQRDFTFTLQHERSYEGALTLDTPHGCSGSKPVSFNLASCDAACLPEPGALVVQRLNGTTITDTETCVEDEKVDVIAPNYHVAGLNWTTDPQVTTEANDAQRRLRVTLPADGQRVYVQASIGSGICIWDRIASAKRCVPGGGGNGTPPGGGNGTPPGGGGNGTPPGGGGGSPPSTPCMTLEALWMILFIVGIVAAFLTLCVGIEGTVLVQIIAAASSGWGEAAEIIVGYVAFYLLIFTASAFVVGAIALFLWLIFCKPSFCRQQEDMEWVFAWSLLLVTLIAIVCEMAWIPFAFVLTVILMILRDGIIRNRCQSQSLLSLPWTRPER